ncbi:MAG: winged helix-turn-helix domain-containing protein [Bacteroidetes bacterium]|nr:winged helix-turn-helix domain-containing protein [Bacteroidota bacterium]
MSLNLAAMSQKNISPDHFTMYPNLAFLKIRQLIKDKKLNEIDISVYFLILDQYYLVAHICKENKTPIKNVSISIQAIAEKLNISKTYANERLKALNNAGLIFRIKAENSFNGNKNTMPAIYMKGKNVIDNSDEYAPLDLPIINSPSIIAAELKTTIADEDDGVPF